jgi:hydroxymethylpyrimidine pyrophosphatase-like HAD family hydrolase
MKNSHPLVLKNANYVSNKTNNESGVSDILEKIIKKINL